MPSSTAKPNLDKSYREAGVRNSRTKHPHNDVVVSPADSFYTIADFKRELRGILLVPLIATREVVKQVFDAFFDLLMAGVQLLTLDGRCFGTLFNSFVHIANAIALTFEGTWDTITTALALYIRTCATLTDVLINLVFDNAPTDPEYSEVNRSSATGQEIAPLAVDGNHSPGIYPPLPRVAESNLAPYSGRYSLYSQQPAARVNKPLLSEAMEDIRDSAQEEMDEFTYKELFQSMYYSGEFNNDVSPFQTNLTN